MVQVQTFSKGKSEDRNEDYFGYTKNCFVIADGATDKSGRKYDGKTGGEIISRLVVRECLSAKLDGVDLVNYLNGKIGELYSQLNISKDIKDPQYRFTCGFICVRLSESKITITYLGDLGFRVNEQRVYQEVKQIDINNAGERARYIKKTGDVQGSRSHILPLLLRQFDHQNNPEDPLGYGVLDGIRTPPKFIKVFEHKTEGLKTIELFSDGYFHIPKKATIEAWNNLHEQVEREDPDKWRKYKSTKSKDDRTIAIITF